MSEDLEKIELLKFRMNNLLENFNDRDSIAVLQEHLNEFVYGYPKLEIDGMWGNETQEGINTYHTQRRYWPSSENPQGHTAIHVNPLEMSAAYQSGLKIPMFKMKERLDEEGNYIE